MKIYLILGLLLAAACAEKKINLDDIERDNLRAESKSKVESIQTDETKYSTKPDVNQQQYHAPSQYNILSNHPDSYIPPQQLQDVKYSTPSEEYIQPNHYAVHEAQYNQANQILPQQNLPPLQYYGGYQQQTEVPAKNIASGAFESQKLSYQPEVVVGNHVQSVQQKAITEKYTKPINKEPAYVNVPMAHLLSYYPHLDINTLVNAKGARLPQPTLHHLTNGASQQVSIPIYAPIYNQKQLFPAVRSPYQYSTVVPTIFTTKVPKGSSYTLPVTPAKLNSPALLTTPVQPVYVQPQQSPNQEKKFLYTQAYIAPSQPQYVQQLVYAQPGVLYGDASAAYSDLYARVPAYIQDNSLRDQANQYQLQQQQLYVAPAIGHEAPKEVPQEQIVQNLPQNFIKVVDEPKTHFVPPQLPAQEFKSDITQLEPVSFEDEESLSVKDHPSSTEPRSLLDSYIPSKVIAAQDAARYRERPIKLEGGFLPSKANFALKKRTSE